MFKALIAAVSLSCLLGTSVQAQDANTIPNLLGKWEGNGQMHHQALGHLKAEAKSSEVIVSSQEGRVFHGTARWSNKASGQDSFSGVIDKDGVTFYVAGHTEGIRIGKLEGPDAFTFYILQPGGPNPRAGFAEFKRVK